MALLPELVLSVWAFGLTLYAGVRHRTAADQRLAGIIALLGLVATLSVVISMWVADVRSIGLPFMMALDAFRWATSAVLPSETASSGVCVACKASGDQCAGAGECCSRDCVSNLGCN